MTNTDAKPIRPSQLLTLRTIIRLRDDRRGRAPSLDDLANARGIRIVRLKRDLDILARAGYVEHGENGSGIRVLRAPPPSISEAQRRVLDAIVRLRDARMGRAPTIDEVAESLGVTFRAVWEHVEVLHREKYVDRVPGEARSIIVLREPEPIVKPTPEPEQKSITSEQIDRLIDRSEPDRPSGTPSK